MGRLHPTETAPRFVEALGAALQGAAAWLSARQPPVLPRWLWATLIVVSAYVVGRVGSRVLAGAIRVLLLAAAVLIGWDLVHAA